MTFKTILAAASGGTATDGALELACRFARRFGAHVEALHVKPDPADLVRYAGDGMGIALTPSFFDKFAADADANAAKARKAFVAALDRHGVALSSHPANAIPGAIAASAVWHEETGYGPTFVARRARFFDLVVLGRSERVAQNPHSDAVEQTLIQSGRPVLLAPAKAPEAVGERIAIGWNGSAEAVRAIAGALPLLSVAREVFIISVGDDRGEDATSMTDYLGWHDINAKHERRPHIPGVPVERQIMDAVRAEGADLLVMGAYGHTPWREFLFGGVTRDAVGLSALPLLLTH